MTDTHTDNNPRKICCRPGLPKDMLILKNFMLASFPLFQTTDHYFSSKVARNSSLPIKLNLLVHNILIFMY